MQLGPWLVDPASFRPKSTNAFMIERNKDREPEAICDRQAGVPPRRIQETSVSAHAIPRLLAENQFGGAARDHVSRRVCPRPRDDPRHNGGVGHA
jgi:hypothetical protein